LQQVANIYGITKFEFVAKVKFKMILHLVVAQQVLYVIVKQIHLWRRWICEAWESW